MLYCTAFVVNNHSETEKDPLLTYQAESWQFVMMKASLDMVDLEVVAQPTDVHLTANCIDGPVDTRAIGILWHQAGRRGM